MDANNQLPNMPPKWAFMLIRIFSLFFLTPIFLIVWTYAFISAIWYAIFTPLVDKKHHKQLQMDAHHIPMFSNRKLYWFKMLSIIEKFQRVDLKKILFISLCIWVPSIIFLVHIYHLHYGN